MTSKSKANLGPALAHRLPAELRGRLHPDEVDDGMRAAAGRFLQQLQCILAGRVDDGIGAGGLRRTVLRCVRLGDDDGATSEDLRPADAVQPEPAGANDEQKAALTERR